MLIRFSDFIVSDLEAIRVWIARDNPRAAERMLEAFRAEFLLIAARPNLYRRRPEYDGDVRFAFVRQYAIIFRVSDAFISIERVVHGRRELEKLIP